MVRPALSFEEEKLLRDLFREYLIPMLIQWRYIIKHGITTVKDDTVSIRPSKDF